MADAEQHDSDHEVDTTPGYQPPAQKTLDEIVSADAEDEALVKYKATLLAGATSGAAACQYNYVLGGKIQMIDWFIYIWKQFCINFGGHEFFLILKITNCADPSYSISIISIISSYYKIFSNFNF